MWTKISSIWALLQWYVRPIVKWFLRRTTKLCELQRICYGKKIGAPRSIAIEESLELSRSYELGQLISSLNHYSRLGNFMSDPTRVKIAVHLVMQVKDINDEVHPQFIGSFCKCVEHIWGYRQLIHDVEKLRLMQYDFANSIHETKLLELWDALMPSTKLHSRITKQWQDIGFQGDDPKTDFRGMGLLGLENLLFFATEFSSSARHVLAHSHHPTLGYDFAIVGINITSMACALLKDGSARTHFYNGVNVPPTIKTFHKFYSYLFYEFDKFWIEAKPKNMMDFSSIRDRFEISVRSLLGKPNTILRISSINTV